MKSTEIPVTSLLLLHSGLEIKILYSIQYCAVKYTNTITWEGYTHVHQTHGLTWLDMWMHICIFENLKLEGLCVGDLLCRVKYGERKGAKLLCQAAFPEHQYVHQSENSPDPVIWVVLWRFYDIGIIDQIISHWW